MYGRGAAAIAEQIHSTKEEAQKIIDDFYKSFPTIKTWMDDSTNFLRENGYTTDFYGRRRRLPDILLPKFSFNLIKQPESFNPIIGCDNRSVEPPKLLVDKYSRMLDAVRYSKEIDKIKAQAAKENLEIHNNGGFIARAERQCVNARIQGGAATMTKIAMIKIFNDDELKKYDFKLLINVHDELIGQCKEEYASQCAERLTTIMKTCISDLYTTPFKCDPAVTHKWYADEISYEIKEVYDQQLKSGLSEAEAFEYLLDKYSEFLPDELNDFLNDKV